ncbi:MAG: heavy-metal-associated domain-containing protein [Mongoliibacter sp.]|uniref:heavy-metal-associated domain-containing protein n=1 Tax=Mongoliibacter sp. TaxID=2022438 RepID=UPI0012F15C19|nr:heavy-metal-associated domain-containing protein [Mongoliibacter sp.]TVP49661.1 MAG: heavy-metal-associated domain-containing protein [Mongoliibacter sp.]
MIKRILFGIISIAAFFTAILAVHIYMVTQQKEGAVTSLTMSRIDFPEAIEPENGNQIKLHLVQLEGVKDVRVNFSNGHIICLYDRKAQSPHDLVASINENFMEQASLFQPSEEMLAQSCPAIDKNSITYKLGAFFQKSFQN